MTHSSRADPRPSIVHSPLPIWESNQHLKLCSDFSLRTILYSLAGRERNYPIGWTAGFHSSIKVKHRKAKKKRIKKDKKRRQEVTLRVEWFSNPLGGLNAALSGSAMGLLNIGCFINLSPHTCGQSISPASLRRQYSGAVWATQACLCLNWAVIHTDTRIGLILLYLQAVAA